MANIRKLAVVGKQCVACGCCEKSCPKQAIQVWNGVTARVDPDVCVGCGKCVKVCPAAVIELAQREVMA